MIAQNKEPNHIIPWCIRNEPQIIDNDMIKTCLDDMANADEAGRLQREEGIPLDEIYTIRLEFKKILRIDHLWILKCLTQLSLNNNLIEKIENLESLIHLKELNLSFNKIVKIENLETLVNLEVLNLFQNKITVIENLENQTELIILSIGNNLIQNKDNILYFRGFKHLKSLNLAGNPCTDEEIFRFYVAAVLPSIVYYEYILITKEEREIGQDIFQTLLREISEVEHQENIIKLKKEKELADAKIHSLSFVEYLGSSYLFDSMFEDDVEGNAFLLLDEVQPFYEEFRDEFVKNCMELFEFGQEQYAIRLTEIKQYQDSVEKAKKEGQLQSIEMMEAFLEKKNHIFYKITKLSKDFEKELIPEDEYYDGVGEIAEQFNGDLQAIWKKAMKFEVAIFSQMEEVNQTFQLSLTDLTNIFIEHAQGTFTYLRNLENNYYDNITEITFKILANEELLDTLYPPELKELFFNKEVLGNALGSTHDVHLQLIDKREDTLLARTKDWLNGIVNNLQMNEIKRNRMKVLEISHFIDMQRQEFAALDIFLPTENEKV